MITLLDIYDGRPDVEAFLYQLMTERLEEGDTNISHVKMPTLQEHRDFIARRVYRAWYVVVTVAGDMIGAVSISKTNELGIVIGKPFRKHGYAKAALKAIMAAHPPLPGQPAERNPHYIANIRAGNTASIALFESLGYKLLQHTYIL